MGNEVNLKRKAEECLSKKVDIPASPLWHMGKAAALGSDSSLKVMQEAIIYLTCKAQAKMAFNGDDKKFLKELYEAFWWGGNYSGFREAAKLANHYVNGNGATISINPEVYRTSKIVIATMTAMKDYISERKTHGEFISNLRCDHAVFLQSKYAAPLRAMNYKTEGKMKANGVLEAAQENHRLHKTDGHFYLSSLNHPSNNGQIKTTWSVKSVYDFEPFEKKDYYTEIPLGEFKLILPDGLSEYMTRIGVANVFHYSAEWHETWSTIQ